MAFIDPLTTGSERVDSCLIRKLPIPNVMSGNQGGQCLRGFHNSAAGFLTPLPWKCRGTPLSSGRQRNNVTRSTNSLMESAELGFQGTDESQLGMAGSLAFDRIAFA
jgi:hypothetical protein